MSMCTMRAWECGLRSVWPHSIPAAWRSLEYANSPVVFGIPSTRRTLSPTRPSSNAAGRKPHRLEDLAVAGAAAEVARQRLAHLVVARLRDPAQEGGDGDDEP